MIKVGIVGGTGYTGVELLRLLAVHPEVELVTITSRSEAGTAVSDMFSSLPDYGEGMKPTEIEPIGRATMRTIPHADRLPPILIWAAFLLIASLAALAADVWLRPSSNGPIVQAIGVTPYAASTSPEILPTTTPVFAATSATQPLADRVDSAPITPPASITSASRPSSPGSPRPAGSGSRRPLTTRWWRPSPAPCAWRA